MLFFLENMPGYLAYFLYHKKEVLTIERVLWLVVHIGWEEILNNLMSEMDKRFFLSTGILFFADEAGFTLVAPREGLE